MVGAQILYVGGLVSMLLTRIRIYNPRDYQDEDMNEIARIYTGNRPDSVSYLIIIARFIFFVSAVMTLFNYSGDQRLKWTLLFISTLVLNLSVYGFMGLTVAGGSTIFQNEIIIISVATPLAIGSLAWLDLGSAAILKHIRIAKGIMIASFLCGSISFPMGYLMVRESGELYITIILIAASSILSFIGLAYLVYFLYYDAEEIPTPVRPNGSEEHESLIGT